MEPDATTVSQYQQNYSPALRKAPSLLVSIPDRTMWLSHTLEQASATSGRFLHAATSAPNPLPQPPPPPPSRTISSLPPWILFARKLTQPLRAPVQKPVEQIPTAFHSGATSRQKLILRLLPAAHPPIDGGTATS